MINYKDLKKERRSKNHTAGRADYRQALRVTEAGAWPEVDHFNLVQGIRDRDV